VQASSSNESAAMFHAEEDAGLALAARVAETGQDPSV